MSTFFRAFALMLAFTGFGATTLSGSGPGTSGSNIKANGVTGFPICTSTTGNCGVD